MSWFFVRGPLSGSDKVFFFDSGEDAVTFSDSLLTSTLDFFSCEDDLAFSWDSSRFLLFISTILELLDDSLDFEDLDSVDAVSAAVFFLANNCCFALRFAMASSGAKSSGSSTTTLDFRMIFFLAATGDFEIVSFFEETVSSGTVEVVDVLELELLMAAWTDLLLLLPLVDWTGAVVDRGLL